MISILVPAHDEEAVVARCLDALVDSCARAGTPWEIIVVANGCTDRTEEAVRTYARDTPAIRLLAVDRPSKPGAIRAGLAAASGDVVVVLDADVTVSPEVVPGLVRALDRPGPLIASPALRLDLAHCGPLARRYHRAWLAQPQVSRGLVGTGLYAVNPAGRSRLAALPDLLADDSWVRWQFEASERVVSEGFVTVYPPRTLRAVLTRAARVLLGNRELLAWFQATGRTPPVLPATPAVPRRPALADRLVHRAVRIAAGRVAAWRAGRGHGAAWSRDRTSRAVTPPPSLNA